ncbi:MAG: alpha-hydroxy-acid oxidizing protein, partial [Fervidicoccaceae archaeon]
VAGRGGPSWIKIEMLRCKRRGDEVLAGAAKSFLSWGIPTAASIVEVKAAHPQAFVIGSGGIRSGLHAAAAMRLGAGAVGMALPLFRLALRSEESLDAYVERFKAELRRALFLTGSRNFEELRRAPIVLGPRLLSWFQQRIPGWQALLRLPIT